MTCQSHYQTITSPILITHKRKIAVGISKGENKQKEGPLCLNGSVQIHVLWFKPTKLMFYERMMSWAKPVKDEGEQRQNSSCCQAGQFSGGEDTLKGTSNNKVGYQNDKKQIKRWWGTRELMYLIEFLSF